MPDAIGPGDWVQAVVSIQARPAWIDAPHLTEGALYQVEGLRPNTNSTCYRCGDRPPEGVMIVGQRGFRLDGTRSGWCPCHFRKWPPPADAEILSETITNEEPAHV